MRGIWGETEVVALLLVGDTCSQRNFVLSLWNLVGIKRQGFCCGFEIKFDENNSMR
ncbi:hypothetical protein [Virgibacillus sp. SK37]|uniref:hypothetical protein n=1 Tax=Virgibacillus sp. SK37 TaxID=403957 RepID=UPI0004D1DE47|nr:hypothetical protein [Virgibacillus sp. SK37]AIF45104.1 hypothetical protein X953_01570 [Virgibacillus sp. SK37]